MPVHFGEERVVEEGLLVNARTCRVNRMSFKEALSNSSWAELDSRPLSQLVLSFRLLFLFFSKDLEIGAESVAALGSGKTLHRRRIGGPCITLHRSGIIILGDFTLHPKVVFTKVSGNMGLLCVQVFVVEAVVGIVIWQGEEILIFGWQLEGDEVIG
jgi:hypothetical protein